MGNWNTKYSAPNDSKHFLTSICSSSILISRHDHIGYLVLSAFTSRPISLLASMFFSTACGMFRHTQTKRKLSNNSEYKIQSIIQQYKPLLYLGQLKLVRKSWSLCKHRKFVRNFGGNTTWSTSIWKAKDLGELHEHGCYEVDVD